jgi:hypothetical protein
MLPNAIRQIINKQLSDAHRNPFHDTPVFASDFLSDLEFLGIINHHLYPKNRTGFVVHFQPVLVNTMFDPSF